MFWARTHRKSDEAGVACDEGARRLPHEPGADPVALLGVGDVEVVEERTPGRIGPEDGVGQADDRAGGGVVGGGGVGVLRHDREGARVRWPEAVGPDGEPLRDQIAVQVGVGEGAAVVAPPAVGMEVGDALGIVLRRGAVRHLAGGGRRHAGPPMCRVSAHGHAAADREITIATPPPTSA